MNLFKLINFKKKLLLFFITFSLFLFSYNPVISQGDSSLKKQINKQTQKGSGYGENVEPKKPQVLIANIIKVVLTLVGSFFIVLLLMAAYNLATSRGESDKIDKAKKTVLRATVGLVIVLMSYSITVLVSQAILSSSGQGSYDYKPGERDRLRVEPFGN
jgi:hypothetical protein